MTAVTVAGEEKGGTEQEKVREGDTAKRQRMRRRRAVEEEMTKGKRIEE